MKRTTPAVAAATGLASGGQGLAGEPATAIGRGFGRRDIAIDATHATAAYGNREIAAWPGLHLATSGRIVRRQILREEN